MSVRSVLPNGACPLLSILSASMDDVKTLLFRLSVQIIDANHLLERDILTTTLFQMISSSGKRWDGIDPD
jgi:hypothetical protein